MKPQKFFANKQESPLTKKKLFFIQWLFNNIYDYREIKRRKMPDMKKIVVKYFSFLFVLGIGLGFCAERKKSQS